jgi:predicted acylesterase/phospholipase RssA
MDDGWDIEFPPLDEAPDAPAPERVPEPEPAREPERDAPRHVSLADYKRATALVLPGGGMKGCYLLGALQYLYDQDELAHIRSFYGTSIGGVLCALLIIGYQPIEIFAYISTHHVQHALSQFNRNIIERRCLLDSTPVVHFLNEMIVRKLGAIPTLAELKAQFARDLCVVTVARDRIHEPLYLTAETHPGLSLVHALHMSISIPFVFGYAVYEGRKYIDGGLMDNFPIRYAAERETAVFGVDLMSPPLADPADFGSELMTIATAPIQYIVAQNKRHLGEHASYVEIQTTDELSLNFGQTTASMYKMVVEGYRQCKTLMNVKCKKD